MTPAALTAVAVVVAVGAFAQATTGFGFALVAIPLVALVVDPVSAVVGVSVVSVPLTAAVAVREREHVDARPVAVLAGASILGMPVGLLVLTQVGDRLLTAIIAVVVLAFTALLALGMRWSAAVRAQAFAGLVAGALSTATGMNGPPLVITLQALGFDPRTFRATISAVFACSGTLSIIGFALAGQVDRTALIVAAAGLPGLALGWLLGDQVFARLDAVRFRRVVLAGLSVTALVALARAVGG